MPELKSNIQLCEDIVAHTLLLGTEPYVTKIILDLNKIQLEDGFNDCILKIAIALHDLEKPVNRVSIDEQYQLSGKSNQLFTARIDSILKILPATALPSETIVTSIDNIVGHNVKNKYMKLMSDKVDKLKGTSVTEFNLKLSHALMNLQEEHEAVKVEYSSVSRNGSKSQDFPSVYIDWMSNLSATKSKLSTGFESFDEYLNGGLLQKNTYVLAGRPGTGKTTLAFEMACNITKAGHNALFFSLEMGREELYSRQIVAHSELQMRELHSINTLAGNPDGITNVKVAKDYILSLSKLYISDQCFSINEILLEINTLQNKLMINNEKLHAVFIDYLQLIDNDDDEKNTSRERQIAKMSRRLKKLGMKKDLPIFLLAQMNRSSELNKDREPQLSDLRESGAIEQDASMVCFLTDEGDVGSKKYVSMYIKKNRNNKLGRINFYATLSKFKFEETNDAPPETKENQEDRSGKYRGSKSKWDGYT